MLEPSQFLAAALEKTLDEFELQASSVQLLEALISHPVTQQAFDELWEALPERDQADCRRDLQSVCIIAVASCLADHRVTDDERSFVRYLLALFRIEDGDLYRTRRNDLIDLLRGELATLDDADSSLTHSSTHAVILQEMLGLSYDEFWELVNESRHPFAQFLPQKLPASTIIADVDAEDNMDDTTVSFSNVEYSFSVHEPDAIVCPKCYSSQVGAGSKGYSLGKAAVGHILLGPLGLLGGLHGSKRVTLSCLRCGYQWEPRAK